MADIVTTYGLSKSYGDVLSVSDLDMYVKEGRIYGFLGPNVPRYEQKTLSIT